jgi:hypothetical protein
MLTDTSPEILRLADVEQLMVVTIEEIDSRATGSAPRSFDRT